jgi:hypothetical protein
MKLSIISYGVPLTHGSITQLNFEDSLSIIDFDGFIFDPIVMSNNAVSRDTFFRRQNEINQLIERKKGIVICILRPTIMAAVAGFGQLDATELLKTISPSVKLIQDCVTPGEDWVDAVPVPGANKYDSKIDELENTRNKISAEILELNVKRDLIANFRRLLFSSGRPLEEIVRISLRLVGFDVPEPESYEGEWDVEAREPLSGRTAIGEIEGPEGAVDVYKSRQLLDYIEGEALLDRSHKGLLIGNGYRLKRPDSEERQAQFSTHALKRASLYATCLLPTTELFKAVCAVLEAPENDELKTDIRTSILETTGVWTFSGQVMKPEAGGGVQ